MISLPRLEGRPIDGIPHDEDGFIGVDEHGGVIGLERVYAVGDVTTFPVKQGALATQQADTVAETIAAAAGAGIEPEPFDPVLRGVLFTGDQPRYLYGRPTGGQAKRASASGRSRCARAADGSLPDPAGRPPEQSGRPVRDHRPGLLAIHPGRWL